MGIAPTLTGWHLFGTDELGRDLLVRTLVGGRISLTVGLLATLVSVSLGVAWGAVAGFMGGRVDALMMRIVDILYAIPYLLIAIMMVTILGRDFYLVVLTISAFSWMDMARVVRGQTLSIRSKEYVEAARAIGVPTWRIIFSHVVPNLLGIVVIYTSITVPGVILTESVLSFLGLGIQPPYADLGGMVRENAAAINFGMMAPIYPATAIALLTVSVNLVVDWMLSIDARPSGAQAEL
jgi:oligopeptide transport system permease protein